MITRPELARLMLNHYVNAPAGATWLDAFNATMANLELRGQVLAEEKREAVSVACIVRRALVACGLEEQPDFSPAPLRSAVGLPGRQSHQPIQSRSFDSSTLGDSPACCGVTEPEHFHRGGVRA